MHVACCVAQVGPDSVGASEGFLGWVAYLGAANAGIPLSIIVKNYGWEVCVPACTMGGRAALWLPSSLQSHCAARLGRVCCQHPSWALEAALSSACSLLVLRARMEAGKGLQQCRASRVMTGCLHCAPSNGLRADVTVLMSCGACSGVLCGAGRRMRDGAAAAGAHGQPEELRAA